MGNSLLSLAVFPVVLLLWFIYKKDPHPESRKILSKVFLFGCLTAIPVIICEILADIVLESFEVEDTGDLFMHVFLGVGLIEEFFKWGVVKMLCFKNKEFDETYDAIVFAVFSSLGFACVENILYVLDGGIAVGIGRALLSVPGHACFGIVMGYYFGLAKKAQSEGRSGGGLQFMALLMPALLHTFYDFLLEMDTEYGLEKLLWLVFVIVMFIVCFVNVFSLSKKNVYLGAPAGSAGGGAGGAADGSAVWVQSSSASQPIATGATAQSGVIQTEARPVVVQQGQQGNMPQPINTGQAAVSGQPLAPVQPVQVVQPAQAVQSVQPVQPVQPTQLTQPVQPVQSVQLVQPVQSVQSNQAAQAGQQVWQNWAPQPVQPVQQSVLTGSEAGVSSSVGVQPVLDRSVQQSGQGAQSESSV